MQVAVIGGGVLGVNTAYFLAAAGHEVVVLERRSNVAEEGSFGNSGLVAPGLAAPWAIPGMPRKLLSLLFKNESPLLLRHKLDPALWRWARRWMGECELERFRINKTRLQRIGFYSRDLLEQLRLHYHLEYEQTGGHLQLFRTERDLLLAQPALALMAEHGVTHALVDAQTACSIEPALASTTALAGALHLPLDEAGNCALFTKQMKTIAQSIGVTFRFNSYVEQLEQLDNRIALHLSAGRFTADAVVLAAGIANPALLGAAGGRIPTQAVQGYSATCGIRNFEDAPLSSLTDEAYKTTITRFGNRVRVAGVAEPGARSQEVPEAAQRTLRKVATDWFPNASNYNNATLWSGMRPMLPDGVPIVGGTPLRNVFVGLDDGANGWTAALGIGKVLSDLVSGRVPDIDIDGLTLSRFG
ncbi:D-amino-acid dehydrogenase [Actimicrobium sp. GrIS 1.19]|uniref:D-amino acid dehydrogenase n=1 Tax=Actimicrobium sp. GrIS 1.19 TaxID=3071708 RepID=UPI002DFB1F6C|nr:D-amino-acid dehydrogenase [Actimicrobium sp. GrIS 1.19]